MENTLNNKDKKYIEKIISKYEISNKEESNLDKLKRLHKKAKNGAIIFAYIFGIVGALIMGFGMSVAMEVIFPNLMWMGIIVGVIGMLISLINYPIYKKMINNGKRKYSNQILELSKTLLNE